MSYLHISNLYKDQRIMDFRWCYAMEKIHGTSAHVGRNENGMVYFAGGAKHETFLALFNQDELAKKFAENFPNQEEVFVFGEAYGGKMQAMSKTYGPNLKFVVFDIKIGHSWLDVPATETLAKQLGFEFVHYEKCATDIELLDQQRDADSVQAIRNGMGPGLMREGIVLRPPFEVRMNNGERVIAKHKRDEFRETKTPREVDPEKKMMLEKADAIANEWVTEMRLTHVLDKLQNPGLDRMKEILFAMVEDIQREGANEFVDTQEVRKVICTRTAVMFKNRLKNSLGENK